MPATLYDEDDRAAFAMFIEGVRPLSERPMPVDALGGGSAKHRARLEEEAALVSAAEDAELRFARAGLTEHLEREGFSYLPFENMHDVRVGLAAALGVPPTPDR